MIMDKLLIDTYHNERHITAIQLNADIETRPVKINLKIRNIVNGYIREFNGITVNMGQEILKNEFKRHDQNT